jgi:hypothetical protein
MRVSALLHSGLANEESRVSALVRKSVRTIDLKTGSTDNLYSGLLTSLGLNPAGALIHKCHEITGQMFDNEYDLAMTVIEGMEARSQAGKGNSRFRS